MLQIALTGGIGAGKTLATDHFSKLGVPVLDADVISHEITAPDSEHLLKITQKLGTQILNEDGTLNRVKLRNWMFQDNAIKHIVESITHPVIMEQMHSRAAQLAPDLCNYCIHSVPLLFEKHLQDDYDRTLLIACSQPIREARVLARGDLTQDEVRRIMDNQFEDSQRRQYAKDVIVNETTTAHLIAEIDQLDRVYRDL